MSSPRRQKITPRALLELKMPGDPQVAPDSRRIAYSVSETDWDENTVTQHLYLTLADDPNASPRQLTRGKDSETSPRWSPDGKWLAFLASRESEEDASEDDEEYEEPKQQVWLLPMDGLGGEAEKLTDAPEGIEAYDWLPDSTGVAYLAREPRPKPLQAARDTKIELKDDAVQEREERFRHQLWRIELDKKKSKLIYLGDYGLGELAVSPNGVQIAVTTNYTGEVNDYHLADLFIVEIASGAARQVTNGPGGKYHPQWASDGQSLLYIRSLNPELSFSQTNLFQVPVTGGESINLTVNFPHDLTGWQGVWQDAQGVIYVSAAVGTTTIIYCQDESGWREIVGKDKRLSEWDFKGEHIHEWHVAPNGSVAYVTSTLDDAPELYWQPPGASESTALTELNDDWMDRYKLAYAEVGAFDTPDGLTIESILTYPPEYELGQKYPLIVYLHGGPHGRMVQSTSPFTFSQIYAAAGYMVLAPNYRGSEGYGDAFSTASRGDLGGADAQDVLMVIDWVIAYGLADPARLGLTGSSYGGYLTNWLITQTNRFKAAVSAFGIFSFVSDFSNSEAPRWELEYLGAAPWDDPDAYARRSPASFAKQVQTPVLLLHGEGDPNTFVANSQEMYNALRLQGKTVEYVHYPREGHGFYEPQHRLDEMRRSVAWFDKYLAREHQPPVHRLGDKLRANGWELTVVQAEISVYLGHSKTRFLEVAFALRDAEEAAQSFTFLPSDAVLTREGGRPSLPVGLPLDVLGQKILAEGRGWKVRCQPGKEERALAVPMALTFRVAKSGGVYALAIKDFPPVSIDIPASDDEKDKD